MSADLHTHTTFSDGSIKIELLPMLADGENLDYLAITDHDTFLAYDYCKNQQTYKNVQLIAGVELTCEDKKRGKQVHLLCYLPNRTEQLAHYFKQMKNRRNVATQKSIQLLREKYNCIFDKDIIRLKQDSGVTFKAHLMNILVSYGYTSCVYGDLFKQLFGKNGSCLVNPEYEDVYNMLAMAHAAKGVVVLAHPTVYDSIGLAIELAEKGLIDGIEIEHPRNTREHKLILYDICQKYNLIVTGGTDFHGQNTATPISIGSCTIDNNQAEKIISLAKQKQTEV